MSVRLGSKGRVSRVLGKSILLAQVALAIVSSAPAVAMLLGSGRHSDADSHFSGVGRLECADPDAHGTLSTGTAWVVGSADTIVTAAHLLFKQASPAAKEGRTLDPGRCAFVLYDGDGHVREKVRVRYALSYWSDEKLRHDSSFDLAVLKLDQPVNVGSIPAIKISHPLYTPAIRLAAFQSGIGNDNRLWLTAGQATMFPLQMQVSTVDGPRISDPRRMLATNADSTPGSSGGMYYNPNLKAAVGIHVGSLCARGEARYDPNSCFNYGLRFDAKLIRMIDSVVAGAPLVDKVVRPSRQRSAERMALLDDGTQHPR